MSPRDTPRDAQATRRRLIEAAADEFAAVGVAGARVDRIAAAATSNKAQIYHYFGSKEELFEAVFEALCANTLDAVPIDPANLPEYAGRLHDYHRAHPRVQRLATWHRLERGQQATVEAVSASYAAKVAAIARAQADGLLPDSYTAVELLGLVLHVSGFWSSNVPEFDELFEADDPVRQREVVVRAVAALIAT
jgi:AcrR family transcriptional regulator